MDTALAIVLYVIGPPILILIILLLAAKTTCLFSKSKC